MFNKKTKKELLRKLDDQISYSGDLQKKFAVVVTEDYLRALSSARRAVKTHWYNLDLLQERYEELRTATLYLEMEVARTGGIEVSNYERIKAMRTYLHLEEPLQLRGLQFASLNYDGWRVEAENTGQLVFEVRYSYSSVIMLEVFLRSLDAIADWLRGEKKPVHSEKVYLDVCRQVTLKSSQSDLQRQAAYILSSMRALASSTDRVEAETAQAFLKASQYKPENLRLTICNEEDVINLQRSYESMIDTIAARRNYVARQLEARRRVVFEELSVLAIEAGFRTEFRQHRFVIIVKVDNKRHKFWRWYNRGTIIKVPYTRKGALLAHSLLQTAIQTVAINDDMTEVEAKFQELERNLSSPYATDSASDTSAQPAVNLRKES